MPVHYETDPIFRPYFALNSFLMFYKCLENPVNIIPLSSLGSQGSNFSTQAKKTNRTSGMLILKTHVNYKY